MKRFSFVLMIFFGLGFGIGFGSSHYTGAEQIARNTPVKPYNQATINQRLEKPTFLAN